MPDHFESSEKRDRRLLPKVGLVLISLLWIAYAAVTAFIISTSHETAQSGVDPRLTQALAQGAANAVPVLLSGGVVLAALTIPLALLLHRRIKA
jgi:hypothetical protein